MFLFPVIIFYLIFILSDRVFKKKKFKNRDQVIKKLVFVTIIEAFNYIRNIFYNKYFDLYKSCFIIFKFNLNRLFRCFRYYQNNRLYNFKL